MQLPNIRIVVQTILKIGCKRLTLGNKVTQNDAARKIENQKNSWLQYAFVFWASILSLNTSSSRVIIINIISMVSPNDLDPLTKVHLTQYIKKIALVCLNNVGQTALELSSRQDFWTH